MSNDIEALRVIARAPMRTVRARDLDHLLTHPRRTLGRLVDNGALTRIAKGVYTAPPDGYDGRTWKPTLEAAGLAVGTARFGNRNAILMGIGAARQWAAIPRAIGVTTIAVPEAGRGPVELDHGGSAHFIPRNLDRIDAVLERTELGPALVTTRAQTLFDLAMKPEQGGMPDEAAAAIKNLLATITAKDLRKIMSRHTRANATLRAALDTLEREGRHG
ncbi:type IV toxin-antitoxin system AbiEi family antitoxin domain-containing protein [Microbacterium gorillae]|uniref:type IV toxin-antitoxin system AbiEi family antitoxin domain-containing protein n=1 Tax=Microbacterium gorillae TaxID=1231063 RepID=UPI003D966F29